MKRFYERGLPTNKIPTKKFSNTRMAASTSKIPTGDFVVDHYTRRQTKIIKLQFLSYAPSHREITFILRRAEKLNDEDTVQLIHKHYYDLIHDEPLNLIHYTKQEFNDLVKRYSKK